MATWNFALDSDDEIEVEPDLKFVGKTALLLLVDSTPEMFKTWKDGEAPFRTALKCCQAILRSKVMSNDRTGVVSLLFVGTKTSKNGSDLDNIYQLHELSPVKVELIEKLNSMKDSEDYDGFGESIGSSEKFNLKDVFWLARMILDEGKATSYQKRIIYFTRNDSPHEDNPNLQAEVIKKYKDLGKVTFTIVAFNDEFNADTFYSRVDDDETSVIKVENLDKLLKAVRMKVRSRRPITKTTFEIAPDVKIGVGIYSFTRPVKPPPCVDVDTRSFEELHKITNEFRADSGMPVLKSEERKMVEIQGEQVVFTPDELKRIKQGSESGLSLIGFFHREFFHPLVWYRSPGYFIYPDEEKITGSKELFTVLLERCEALQKVALVKMVLTRGKNAKLACLVPNVDVSLFPQGFHVFPVPFSDEMRQYDFEFPNNPSETLVELMKSVIKKLTNRNFDLLDVNNPAIQSRWREMEREALNIAEEHQEEYHDLTLPNDDLMIQRLSELPGQIEKETGGFATQRSTASVVARSANINMAMEVKNRRVEKLTIPVLKDFLQTQNVDIEKMKRKADYVQAVYNYFQ